MHMVSIGTSTSAVQVRNHVCYSRRRIVIMPRTHLHLVDTTDGDWKDLVT